MHKRGFYGAVLLLIIGLFLPVLSFAETIILKSGKKIEGKIVERTDEYIKVDSGIGMALTYFFDMIESIKETPSSASKDLSVPDAEISPTNKQATIVGNNGILLIKEGKWDEGLGLMKQATEIAPEDPLLHMNYGSMLFTHGQLIFESDNKQEAKPIFNEAEREFNLAISLFKDDELGKAIKSQCSFLLGDIYFHVYNDKEKAKSLYKKALEYDPRHSGAINALNKVSGAEK